MDRKAKKRLEVIRQKMQKLQHQLSGAKQQQDEPDEVERIQKAMSDMQVEIDKLKAS